MAALAGVALLSAGVAAFVTFKKKKEDDKHDN
jgi:LPXTG-motif cell wall-anchored protein